ncbi:MAG: sialidase family protein [Acidobacteriota bacterium]
MRSRFSLTLVALASGLVILSGCSGTRGDDTVATTITFNEPVTVGDLERNPADSFLRVAPNGDVLLSWTEQEPGAKADGRNFLIATVDSEGNLSSEVRQMNDRPGELSSHGGENVAKFAVNADSGISGVWTTRGPDYHTGNIWYAHGEATGSFDPSVRLNDDESNQWNHAFSALATAPDGKMYAAWMDGRNRGIIGFDNSDPTKINKRVYDLPNSQLFMGVSEDGGATWGPNYPISDFEVCSCCRPTIVFVDEGETMVMSYRLVRDDYLRDQVMVRSTDGGKTFSDPVYISEDGWVTEACPHAGVSIETDSQDRIHALWWTAGRVEEEAGIYYNYSADGGRSFAPRQLISRTPAKTVLHAMLTVDKNDTVWAAFEDLKGESTRKLYLTYLDAETGEWSEHYELSDDTRNALFPVVVADDSNLYVSWTERKGETAQVKLQTIELAGN